MTKAEFTPADAATAALMINVTLVGVLAKKGVLTTDGNKLAVFCMIAAGEG
jgi:hypothetical protein